MEAFRLLARERSVRRLAVLPLLVSASAVFGAVAFVVAQAGMLWGLATGWMPFLEAAGWLSWLWVGPVNGLLAVAGTILFVGLAGVIVVVAFLLAGIIAAPLHDLLSQRVEEVVAGRSSGESGWIAEALRALRDELKRLALFFTLQILVLGSGFLVPPLAPVVPFAMAGLVIFFLPLEYGAFVFDRQGVPFRERRRWVTANPAATLGFGAGAFALSVIPVLNFLVVPVFVVAGTLLALRCPIQPDFDAAGRS